MTISVCIIGSGLSGLIAAAFLSREGFKVKIFEQFSEIGGVTVTLHKEGYSWDLGPLLIEGFAPHEVIGKTLIELGIYDKIKIINEDRGQSLPDFQLWKPKIYKGPYWRKEQLKQIFPDEKEGLDGYYKLYDRIMSIMAINRRLIFSRGLKTALLKLKMLPYFWSIKK